MKVGKIKATVIKREHPHFPERIVKGNLTYSRYSLEGDTAIYCIMVNSPNFDVLGYKTMTKKGGKFTSVEHMVKQYGYEQAFKLAMNED